MMQRKKFIFKLMLKKLAIWDLLIRKERSSVRGDGVRWKINCMSHAPFRMANRIHFIYIQLERISGIMVWKLWTLNFAFNIFLIISAIYTPHKKLYLTHGERLLLWLLIFKSDMKFLIVVLWKCNLMPYPNWFKELTSSLRLNMIWPSM